MSRPPANGVIRASDRRAVLGLVVQDGVVTIAPPLAVSRWHPIGRDAREVWRELARAGVRLEWLPATD